MRTASTGTGLSNFAAKLLQVIGGKQRIEAYIARLQLAAHERKRLMRLVPRGFRARRTGCTNSSWISAASVRAGVRRLMIRGSAGTWVERIERACVLDDDSAALALAAANCAEQQLTVVDVREVAVDVSGPTPRPLAALERIRTCGASARTDLGKQSGGDCGNR